MADKTERKDFIANYRQQAKRKPNKGSSEHQHGKRKRWYEQLYRPDDPVGAKFSKNKLGWCVEKGVPRSVNKGPRLAKPGECPDAK
jgi:hypothetical protein